MSDKKFDKSALLKDIYDVVQKHNLEALDVTLKITVSDKDFIDKVHEHLRFLPLEVQGYHANEFINQTFVYLDIEQVKEFEDVHLYIKEKYLPYLQAANERFTQAYPMYSFKVYDGFDDDSYWGKFAWLGFDCRLSDEESKPYNTIRLFVELKHLKSWSAPTLKAYVGWLAFQQESGVWDFDDRESANGGWGGDIAHVNNLQQVELGLPDLITKFEDLINNPYVPKPEQPYDET